ncbi:flavin reductase family protein [Nocardioides sp. YIM 152588]|uniref:flavin reductase family protein n=1 Tax=Nocardioides sp. YIM 152588 TaxID=3158259 RepID=UPI0032E3E23A
MGARKLITAFDEALLRQAFGCFPSGVTALCGTLGGEPAGMTASSFTSVSLDPPLVSVCVARTSSTWRRMAALPSVGLSVLASDHGGVARALAARGTDRFAGVDWTRSASGAVFVPGATLWLECSPHRTFEAGDHDIVVLRVEALLMDADVEPIVFHRSAFREIAPCG